VRAFFFAEDGKDQRHFSAKIKKKIQLRKNEINLKKEFIEFEIKRDKHEENCFQLIYFGFFLICKCIIQELTDGILSVIMIQISREFFLIT